jgi:anti-sigma factor RsiW
MTMCNKELLVAYVYDDISDIDRGRFERHLRECAACRDEAAAMRSVRTDLAAWTPPEPDLGFSIVQHQRPSWRTWWTPAFGLAAAALLVLAAAAGLANVEVTYGAGGFAVRTGWHRSVAVTSTSAAVEPAASGAASDAQSARLEKSIAEITRRVRELEGARTTPVQTVSNSSTATRLSDAEILRRVGDLLARSESRQQQELALRIAQVIRDVEAQRVADLGRIQQGFGRIDAMTSAEAASHRELANYILTSSKQQK